MYALLTDGSSYYVENTYTSFINYATLYLAQANWPLQIRLINRLLFQTFWRIETLLQF